MTKNEAQALTNARMCMAFLKRLLKRLFCRHQFEFHRNIHGDEVMLWGWKRSIWICEKCGKVESREDGVWQRKPEGPDTRA